MTRYLLPFCIGFCAAFVLVSKRLIAPVQCDGGVEWIDRIEERITA